MGERLTKDEESALRASSASYPDGTVARLLAEIDALRAERDEARKVARVLRSFDSLPIDTQAALMTIADWDAEEGR